MRLLGPPLPSPLTPRSGAGPDGPGFSSGAPNPRAACCPARWPRPVGRGRRPQQRLCCPLRVPCPASVPKHPQDPLAASSAQAHPREKARPPALTWLYLPSLTSFCLLRNQSGILYCRGFCMMVMTRSTWGDREVRGPPPGRARGRPSLVLWSRRCGRRGSRQKISWTPLGSTDTPSWQ